MAGPRQPVQLIMAKGAKHLTKEEIEDRVSSEVQPCTEGIAAPSYLTAKQKKQFDTIADQLQRIGIMGETDCDALARYITAQSFYEQAVKDLRQIQKDRPKSPTDDEEDVELIETYREQLGTWVAWVEIADKRVDKYFKQAQTAAAALGLSITSRCKLAVPKSAEAPKVNKFAKFGKPIPGKAAGSE